ncbi:hypothetical protein BJ165DRAFT_1411741 [Panaeolus papilionaceus]|nr:hypothetical protein BJ165DRAFT_1411741 [Panaeolus papilionaceus]
MALTADTKLFLQKPLEIEQTSSIAGNAPRQAKELALKWLSIFRNKGKGYAGSVSDKLRVVEVSFQPKPTDPSKLEGVVVCEVEVIPEMCNTRGVADQGYLVYLLDECSTTSMIIGNTAEGRIVSACVSQTINAMFHAPATIGTKLRIVNRSLAVGDASNSAKTEIWDVQSNRLVASGAQLSMPPSTPMNWLLVKKAKL